MASRVSAFFFPWLIISSWIVVFILRLLPLGGTWDDLKLSTWFLILLWMSVYFSALIVGIIDLLPDAPKKITSFDNNKLLLWIKKLSFVSMIGAILIAYEFAIVRGYGFSSSVAMIRVMEVNASKEGFGGSWISGLGRLMTPALMIAWVLAILKWKQLTRINKGLLLFASLVVFTQQYMFEGGRFYYAALLTIIFITAKFSGNEKKKITLGKKQVLLGIFGFIVLICFGNMFVSRYQDAGRDFYEAYSTWAHVYDLEQNEELLHARLSGESAGFWLGITMLWAYITQGFNELNVLLTSDLDVKAYGLFQFSQIGQVLAKLFDSSLKFDRFQNLPHTGTYITFFGASFVDFGFLGALVFSGFVGWFTGKSIRNLRMGRLNGLGLNAPLLITLGIFAPVISLVTNLWPAFFWAFFIHLPRFRLLPSTPLGKIQSQ
jgi:hypothetical protein